MGIRLFDIQNNEIVPSEHCYVIKSLKRVMDEYPNDYKSIYAYLFYMSCLNEEENPFANVQEIDKEELVLQEVGGDFSPDEQIVSNALDTCITLYETVNYRLYLSIKKSAEELARYLSITPITDGRDGNGMFVLKAQKEFDQTCKSVDNRYKAFKEEQSTISRGGQQIAYDQM